MTSTVQANTMVACEKLMIEGRADFLLCHDHPAVATRLTPERFRSIEIGQDVLVPVATPHLLDTCKPDSLPYLAYTVESRPGRILAAAWASAGQHPPESRSSRGPAQRSSCRMFTMSFVRMLGMANFVPEQLDNKIRSGYRKGWRRIFHHFGGISPSIAKIPASTTPHSNQSPRMQRLVARSPG